MLYVIIIALLLDYVALRSRTGDNFKRQAFASDDGRAIMHTHFEKTGHEEVRSQTVDTSKKRTFASEDGRPIMHTFFEKTGDGEADLLEAWKEEWTLAGFEARVLTLKDAKKHPSFTDMQNVLNESSIYLNGYNAMCMYRWLAMAASGGGWMSDYDTFPTNFPINEAKTLPNNGNFTSFQEHVPSLLSGTAEEWTRVAVLLMKSITRVESPNPKTDMHAFLVIKNEGIHNVMFLSERLHMEQGFLYKEALSHDSPRSVNCETMARGRAIHLSHKSIRDACLKGMFPVLDISLGMAFIRRGKAARIFLADWRHQCGGSNVK